MDLFLGKITQHAMNYAIRSGIAITSTYAIRQCSRLLKTVDNHADFQELQDLQERLDSKIRIISPAIDMIDLISARGNTSLESAVTLTKSLRVDIQTLATRLTRAASAEEVVSKSGTRSKKKKEEHETELHAIIRSIRRLLARIEDAVPLINLAITTSGASLSTSLPATVSPSRMLQASTFLTAGDTQYALNPSFSVQVGPTFTLSLYMLFSAHAQHENVGAEGSRAPTWQEVIHKGQVRLLRTPLDSKLNVHNVGMAKPESDKFRTTTNEDDRTPSSRANAYDEARANEYVYQLEIIEDLDDGRFHTFETNGPQPGQYHSVRNAGIRDVVAIHEVSKIFYADTGKILNVGGSNGLNNPILLLKRDVHAPPPRRMTDFGHKEQFQGASETAEAMIVYDEESQSDVDSQLHRESSPTRSATTFHAPKQDHFKWPLPIDLDPEWLAFEVYSEDRFSEGEDSSSGQSSTASEPGSPEHDNVVPAASFAVLGIGEKAEVEDRGNVPGPSDKSSPSSTPRGEQFGSIRTSLSLLEMLIRLTSLQQFQQTSHLATPDELLTFFLENGSTTGAGHDADSRRRQRQTARSKVGFDPYDESPIKHHGEDYQYQNHADEHGHDGASWRSPAHSSSHGLHSPGARDWTRDSSPSSQQIVEPWLSKRTNNSPLNATSSEPGSSPAPPRKSGRASKNIRPASTLYRGSPLGRSLSVETDSALGTSPTTPAVGQRFGGEKLDGFEAQ